MTDIDKRALALRVAEQLDRYASGEDFPLWLENGDEARALSAILREQAPTVPKWWKPSPTLKVEMERYRGIRADFEDFDGDRRGIGAALMEAEFRVLAAIVRDHTANDDEDSNALVVSPLAKLLDKIVPAPPAGADAND